MKSFARVAVVNEAVDNLHRRGAGEKIKPHRKRQELAAGFRDVDTVNFHDGANWAGLLQRDLLHEAGEFLLAQDAVGLELRTVFENGDEAGILRDDAIAYGERLEKKFAGFFDDAARAAGVDGDGVSGFGGAHFGGGHGGGTSADRKFQRAGNGGVGDDGVAGPFHGAVGP